MNTVKLAVVALSALAFAAPAFAETRADHRQEYQDQRIDQGVASGALTAKETRQLERGQAHIQRMEARALADGTLTWKEKARLEHAQDVQSRKICHQKHDRQRR